VIGLRRAADAVYAVRDSLEETGFDKPRHRPPGNAGGSGLLEGNETPLPFGKVADTREWAWHAAKYNTRVILCSMVVAPAGRSRPLTAFPRGELERDLTPAGYPLS
jgi:hypothetical protein